MMFHFNICVRRFKPCYKWNTFNTRRKCIFGLNKVQVLNLVISGIPSILEKEGAVADKFVGFKPCYKWNTFNTLME